MNNLHRNDLYKRRWRLFFSKAYSKKTFIKEHEKNILIHKEHCKDILITVDDFINNGINVNGIKREFDELDWYEIYHRFFQNYSRKYVVNMFNELDNEGNRLVNARTMVSKAFNPPFLYNFGFNDTRSILEENSFGLTIEEKEDIINYFNQYRIPINYSNYLAAVKRIVIHREHLNNSKENKNRVKRNMVNFSVK